MLNLLFISDSPKIDYVKKTLPSLLKVVVDVAPDFDSGLNDVFEKRPTAVCIQDQIAGAKGENFARHILMLLGSDAPTFILVHDGNSKAKRIRGLFSYVVDLNQPEAKLTEEIQRKLKVIIRNQRDKIIIPSVKIPDSIMPLEGLSVKSRNDSDTLIGNLFSDIETGGLPPSDAKAHEPLPEIGFEQTKPSFTVPVKADVLAEIRKKRADLARKPQAVAERPLSATVGDNHDSMGEDVTPPALVTPPAAHKAPKLVLPDAATEAVRDSSDVTEKKQDATPAGSLPSFDPKVHETLPEPGLEQTKPSFTVPVKADVLAEIRKKRADLTRKPQAVAEQPLSATAGDNHESGGENPVVVTHPAANMDTQPVLPDAATEPVRDSSQVTVQKQDNTSANRMVIETPTPETPAPTGTTRNVLANVSHFPPVTSADLFISHKDAPAGIRIPEDKPPVFEEYNRLKSNGTKRLLLYISITSVFLFVVGWYFLKPSSDVPTATKQRTIPVVTPTPAPTPTVNPSLPVAQPVPTAQTPAQGIIKPSLPATFPAFIPRDGHDKSFAVKNPGWERYISEKFEFRLFRADDRLRAIQILAIKDNVLPDSLVKTVLTELAGSSDYQIISKEKRSGLIILRGTVAQKAEVIFYNKDSSVRAFVVSLH
jgi:hypothetical protein